MLLVLGISILLFGAFWEYWAISEAIFGIEMSLGSGMQWQHPPEAVIIPSIITAVGITLIVMGIKRNRTSEKDNPQPSVDHLH